MGIITFYSGSSLIHKVEIGGQKRDRGFQTEHLDLNPTEGVELKNDFHTLIYVHISPVPDGPLRIHIQELNETYIITPSHWGNIWVYGLEIILAGYITRRDYHQNASLQSPKSGLLPNVDKDVQVLCLPISKLHPLSLLFSRTKQWSSQREL
jgi:hypothetical protein